MPESIVFQYIISVPQGELVMPTYEYECIECKHRFDVFQSMNDDPVEKCAKCNGKVRKLFSSTGIIFKGSGFYVNDYKNNVSSGKRADNNAKKDAAQDSAPSPSESAKPAKPAEPKGAAVES
jgi:putative FmdB family regulatory protein